MALNLSTIPPFQDPADDRSKPADKGGGGNQYQTDHDQLAMASHTPDSMGGFGQPKGRPQQNDSLSMPDEAIQGI